MAARLTDKQKKKIIADYVELGSYNAVAKRHGISHKTVARVVNGDGETTKKAQAKKEQNTLDMLEFLDSRKKKTQDLIDLLLEHMPDKIPRASLVQIVTAYGILVDKSTLTAGCQKQEEGVKVIIDVGNKTQ